jgi:outer membrane protein OmpA-like peptidoglycan-associated protein
MAKNHFRTTTALVAGLSLLIPLGLVPSVARAQEVRLFCLNYTAPPCPAGEPEDGSLLMTPADARAARRAARGAENGETAAQAEAAAAAQAEADAAAQVEAEAAAQAEADAAAQAEAEAAAQAEAEAAAQAEADAAAQAEAEAETAAQAEADAAAQAEAEAAAQAEADAVAQAEAEAAAQAQAEAAAQAQAEAAAQSETDAAVQAEADAEAQVEAEVAVQAEADAAAQVEAEAEAEAEAQAEAEAEAHTTLPETDPTVEETPVSVEAAVSAEGKPDAAPVEVVTETVRAPDVRTSEEDFATAVDGSDREDNGSGIDGLSDLEKVLLLGLGAVIVGSVLNDGDEVVSNLGDRVVVRGDDGLTIYKDDDALLREAGTEITTQTFEDGSTLTTLTYADRSQVVTIRDPRGRVLRRALVRPDGTTTQLFDDLTPSAPVNVSELRDTSPAPITISVADTDRAALREAMLASMDYVPNRTYSLRQIREIKAVRALVPSIDLDTIKFATGSAAIERRQARSLVKLGRIMETLLADNPQEVFLIEGHTDAVGSDSYNLALSDRRAESVALALTEAFDIPPQNLIVQGYGEEFLKIDTLSAEQRNRRAAIRRITPLLNQGTAG